MYTLSNKTLLNVRQTIENHIWVEEASVTIQKNPHFQRAESVVYFLKFHVVVKVNLDNYNDLTSPKEHIQNTRSILELITENSDVITLSL